ncbi:MAG TPA: hypothetical protein PKZ32_09815 [Candidatus Melainabacteria bacterium]|nr:hypothetical protein [Candidatus Melainabacteria bacterium]
MEIISSLGLIVIILLALNHMAGGKPDNVLKPVGRICSSILGLALGIVSRIAASVIGLIGGSIKSIPPPGRDDKQGGTSEKPPPRW